MTRQFQKTCFATAFSAALLAAPAAMAESQSHYGSDNDANIQKTLDTSVKVKYQGKVDIKGTVRADGLAAAVVDTEQRLVDNEVLNDRSENNASIDGNALRDANGNIGVNAAAGDNNAQANSTAIAKIDESFVFGSADAEVFADQVAGGNMTTNHGSYNNASLGGNALRGAAGKIGVNIASGNNNAQQNGTAITRGTDSLAQANTSTYQGAAHNNTVNVPSVDEQSRTVSVSVNMDGVTGTYNGMADQKGDVYPDIWGADTNDGDHKSTPRLGHVDLDSEAQGAQDPNEDGGALLFSESGDIALSGTATGSVTYVSTVVTRRAVNNASIGGNALRGATGDIGVNVVAGTNNLQSNSLAIAATGMSTATPPNGGGGGG